MPEINIKAEAEKDTKKKEISILEIAQHGIAYQYHTETKIVEVHSSKQVKTRATISQFKNLNFEELCPITQGTQQTRADSLGLSSMNNTGLAEYDAEC